MQIRLDKYLADAGLGTRSTVRKIKQVLKRALIECGYLASTKATELQPVFPSELLIEAIQVNRDQDAFAAFNYFPV